MFTSALDHRQHSSDCLLNQKQILHKLYKEYIDNKKIFEAFAKVYRTNNKGKWLGSLKEML